MTAKCDCIDEFGDGRHDIDCPLAPDLTGWTFYPHDGELETGGVFVNPDDDTCIYLLVRNQLVRAEQGKHLTYEEWLAKAMEQSEATQ